METNERAQTWPKWMQGESVQEYANRVSIPSELDLNLGNDVTLKAVLVPPRDFMMGETASTLRDLQSKSSDGLSLALFCCSLCLMCVVYSLARHKDKKGGFQLRYGWWTLLVFVTLSSIALYGLVTWHNYGLKSAQRQAHINMVKSNEMPAHLVHMTVPYYLGKYEVTQRQYLQVTNRNPSTFLGEERPVENITW